MLVIVIFATYCQLAAVILRNITVSLSFAFWRLLQEGRAKSQAALISVSGVIETDTDSVEQPVKMLLVDNVQLLTPQEAEALKPKFSKMLCFAALAGQLSRKREQEPWSSE